MSDKDLRKKLELQQKLKKTTVSVIFDEKNLPQVKKDIDELLEELDKELAKNKKIIAEIDKVLLETMSREQLEKLANSVRFNLGFQT